MDCRPTIDIKSASTPLFGVLAAVAAELVRGPWELLESCKPGVDTRSGWLAEAEIFFSLLLAAAASGDDENKALLDIIADDQGAGPENLLQTNDMKLNIIKWLQELNPKQKEVLARRFGLLGYEPATLEDVGIEIGLTRERVRQIQVEALKRLKDVMHHHGLDIESLFNFNG